MERLFELFEEMGYKQAEGFFRQGSLTDETYPDHFFTFWNIDTPNTQHRDNKAKEYTPYIQVGFYTNDAKKVYSEMDEFIKQAQLKGFAVEGRARDANADKDNYFGRVCYIRIRTKSED